MAYSLGDRFRLPQKQFALLDPGSYQHECANTTKLNKVPFLSKTPRNTQPGVKLWTHTLYDSYLSQKIPNCSSLMSKKPRFPYEAFSEADLENILCKCGIQRPCECPTGEEEAEVICQGKVSRRMFKGPPPRAVSNDEGLSVPSKTDGGFVILPNGTKRRIRELISEEHPPFYDATVYESTAFYHGCKWSKWSSKRSQKSLEPRPGPADYTIEKLPIDICQEKVREHKRKTSKQPRFIEIIQERNILERRPGPTTYSPTIPKGTDLKYLGPKAERDPNSKYIICPGPADYFLRRELDSVDIPDKSCRAKLPEPACFGVKALRFKPQREEGPSPASYYANYKPQIMHCSKTPFGVSSIRFKSNIYESDEEEYDEFLTKKSEKGKESCPSPTWEFKSKTIRMKPLIKKLNEPSPADLSQNQIKIKKRTLFRQYLAPFWSSDARFQPWHNWIAILGKEKTPGPCYYNLEKPRCLPAVHYGPLSRAPRFSYSKLETPAPNEYKAGGGIEDILRTYNKRLIDNMRNQHKFHWEPPKAMRTLSIEEKESILLNKSIKLLDVGDNDNKSCRPSSQSSSHKASFVRETKKPKMLKCFVYGKQVPAFV